MVEAAFRSGCEMCKSSRRGLGYTSHVTPDIGPPSLISDHRSAEVPYIRRNCQCQVRTGSRVRMKKNGAHSDVGRVRQGILLRFRSRTGSGDPRTRGSACGCRNGNGREGGPGATAEMASKTQPDRFRMSGVGSHQRSATRVAEIGRRKMKAMSPRMEMCKGEVMKKRNEGRGEVYGTEAAADIGATRR